MALLSSAAGSAIELTHRAGMSQHAHLQSEVSPWERVIALSRRWSQPVVVAFVVALVGTVTIAMLQGEKPFLTDAAGYWQLATTFTVNGHFSLLNYSDVFKGYAFPLMLYGLQTLAGDFTWTSSFVAKLFNALTFAAIGAVLGPALIRVVWPSQPSWGIRRRLVLTALLLVFWSGYLNTPMSDFPTLAAALATLVAVARTDRPGWMLLAGVALAVTINLRASYGPFALAVVAIIAWTWFVEQRGTAHASALRRIVCAGLFIVGFAVVSLPQSLYEHRYHGSWSFIPGATVNEPPGEYWGTYLGLQGYDTYVLNGEARVEMRYVYPAGERLLKEQPGGKILTNSQYAGLFVSHPLVMVGAVVRNVVNGLDPLHSTAFVENLHNEGRVWGRIAGFLLLFAALLRVLWPSARRLLGSGRLRYLVAMVLTCVSTMPIGGIRRFMLPLYLLIYVLALTPRWPNPMGKSTAGLRRFRTPAVIGICFVAYASFVWYITSDAIDHLVYVDGVTRTRLNLQ